MFVAAEAAVVLEGPHTTVIFLTHRCRFLGWNRDREQCVTA